MSISFQVRAYLMLLLGSTSLGACATRVSGPSAHSVSPASMDPPNSVDEHEREYSPLTNEQSATETIPAATALKEDRTYFYHGQDYGSESQFNPATMIINGGFDIYRNPSYNNQVSATDFSTGFKNVMWNLIHPGQALSEGGFDRVVAHEIFPIRGFSGQYGQWMPNYLLHTLGEGMLYRKMTEWYDSHNAPVPEVLSLATVVSMQLLNEVVENGSYVGPNADPVVDMLLFNVLGYLLFSSDTISSFFSGDVQLSYWPGQAALDIREGRMINQSENYALKIYLGSWTKMRFLAYAGSSGMFGLSVPVNTRDDISVTFGGQLLYLKVDPEPGTRIMIPDGKVTYSGGIFWDRNESLMASLIASGTARPLVTLNVYPGAHKFGELGIGLFMSAGVYDGFSLGITFNQAPVVPAVLVGYDPSSERF